MQRHNLPSTTSRRTLAMTVLCATQLMVILDGSIVAVALPTIRTDLGFTDAGLSWVVNGFFVAFAGLLLLSGRLGDLLGQRRVFVAGLVVFTLASAGCGLAWDPALLVAGRFVQGIGGAMSSAVVLGMIAGLYPEPGERARAFAVFAFVGSAGGSVGVVAGGALTQLASWHWVFLVNVPIGLLVIPAALRFLDDVRGPGLRAGVDVPGAVLATAGLMIGVYGITRVPDEGWLSFGAGGPALLGVGLVALFVQRQRRASTPLLPLSLFASRRFSVSNAVLFTMTVAGFGFQFLSALYLQEVLGFGPLATGLSYLSVTSAIAVSALFVSGRLAGRFGPERVLVGGLLLFVAGMLLMARFPVDGGYLTDVAPAMVLMGIGFGLAMPQVTTLAMADADPMLAGVASGIVNTTQQVGGAVGLAVVATIAASRTAGLVGTGVARVPALASGLRDGFLVAAATLVVGALLATYLWPRTRYDDVAEGDAWAGRIRSALERSS